MQRQAFIQGARDTIPLVLGAIPFGIVYGALAINSGLSGEAAFAMSALVYAGSAQFIAAGLVAEGVSIALIILTTFVVNLRHMLYAASVGPFLKHLPESWRATLAFFLTDETYAVSIIQFAKEDRSEHPEWYMAGSSAAMYINWQICTLIGIVAGQRFENAIELGLDFAMVVTFIGLVVPLIITRPMLASALSAAVSSILLNGLPNRAGLLIAALIGVAVGVIAEMLQKDSPSPIASEAQS
ncbi:MAG: AzlC family ABC transporter permease [Chloroflexi bacterium]|nr:AzlC family ABC transporter permease [Chloroflexota bacterium]